MTVYHGSYTEIIAPDVLHSREKVDFGRGFYITDIKEQAVNYCQRFIRRGRGGVLTQYELDDKAFVECNSIVFDKYDEEWLDFVTMCRRKTDTSNYELVMGGVANDRVFDTIELYFDGLISKREALGRLIYTKPNNQICIRSQRVIDGYLHYERSKGV